MFLSALKDEKIQKKHILSYRKSCWKWEFYIFFSSSVNGRPGFLLHKMEIKLFQVECLLNILADLAIQCIFGSFEVNRMAEYIEAIQRKENPRTFFQGRS